MLSLSCRQLMWHQKPSQLSKTARGVLLYRYAAANVELMYPTWAVERLAYAEVPAADDTFADFIFDIPRAAVVSALRWWLVQAVLLLRAVEQCRRNGADRTDDDDGAMGVSVHDVASWIVRNDVVRWSAIFNRLSGVAHDIDCIPRLRVRVIIASCNFMSRRTVSHDFRFAEEVITLGHAGRRVREPPSIFSVPVEARYISERVDITEQLCHVADEEMWMSPRACLKMVENGHADTSVAGAAGRACVSAPLVDPGLSRGMSTAVHMSGGQLKDDINAQRGGSEESARPTVSEAEKWVHYDGVPLREVAERGTSERCPQWEVAMRTMSDMGAGAKEAPAQGTGRRPFIRMRIAGTKMQNIRERIAVGCGLECGIHLTHRKLVSLLLGDVAAEKKRAIIAKKPLPIELTRRMRQEPFAVKPMWRLGTSMGGVVNSECKQGDGGKSGADGLDEGGGSVPTSVSDSKSNDDVDIVCESTVESVQCPLSGKTMRIPVRGHGCEHTMLFDLEAWLESSFQHSTWYCPIRGCKVNVHPWKLVVDYPLMMLLHERRQAGYTVRSISREEGGIKVVQERRSGRRSVGSPGGTPRALGGHGDGSGSSALLDGSGGGRIGVDGSDMANGAESAKGRQYGGQKNSEAGGHGDIRDSSDDDEEGDDNDDDDESDLEDYSPQERLVAYRRRVAAGKMAKDDPRLLEVINILGKPRAPPPIVMSDHQQLPPIAFQRHIRTRTPLGLFGEQLERMHMERYRTASPAAASGATQTRNTIMGGEQRGSGGHMAHPPAFSQHAFEMALTMARHEYAGQQQPPPQNRQGSTAAPSRGSRNSNPFQVMRLGMLPMNAGSSHHAPAADDTRLQQEDATAVALPSNVFGQGEVIDLLD